MGELFSGKKAEVQYDSVPLICYGFMKLALLIFFSKFIYFFSAFLNENVLVFDKQSCFTSIKTKNCEFETMGKGQ